MQMPFITLNAVEGWSRLQVCGLAWHPLPGMNGFIIWLRMLFKAKASYVAICHCKETVHPEIDAELL